MITVRAIAIASFEAGILIAIAAAWLNRIIRERKHS